MSNLQRLRNICYRIEKYLTSKGIKPTVKNTSKLTAEFLKSKGLPYTKWNPRYKGLFTADICNCEEVSKNFEEFKSFIESKI